MVLIISLISLSISLITLFVCVKIVNERYFASEARIKRDLDKELAGWLESTFPNQHKEWRTMKVE